MSNCSRQQPGSACEECRKRKLRCDRQKPRCGTCLDADITCVSNTKRLRRGPKQGSGLKALRTRIGTLEGLLRNRQEDLQPSLDDQEQTENTPSDGSGSDDEPCQPTVERAGLVAQRASTPGPSADPVVCKRNSMADGIELSELMRADLDHLYFERAHPIVPILQKHGYYSWTNGPQPDIHRRCLRFAMWTLAMSLSTRFENMREKMYAETRQMLEARDLGENDMVQVRIEQAQAWIMVTFYEFLRTDYRRGYMSAGRVFRLVQLLRLHEVDSPTANAGDLSATSFGESIASEERRRVFWVAYCLDRFISVGEKGLLTLNEDVICTCLPSLEIDHQDNHFAPRWFLSEAVTSTLSFSPLAECAITATLCGRVLAHDQVSAVEQMYGNAARDFWVRHEWLQGILKQRRDSLHVNHPRCSAFADPMLIFTSMTLHATTIYMCEIAETSIDVERHTETVIEYQNQASMAAREIARLSKEQDQAHVFMPFAVFLSARRLITHRQLNALKGDRLETESLEGELQECMEALDKMQKMNNLAKYYLQVLKSEDFQASARFAGGRQSCTIEIGHEL